MPNKKNIISSKNKNTTNPNPPPRWELLTPRQVELGEELNRLWFKAKIIKDRNKLGEFSPLINVLEERTQDRFTFLTSEKEKMVANLEEFYSLILETKNTTSGESKYNELKQQYITWGGWCKNVIESLLDHNEIELSLKASAIAYNNLKDLLKNKENDNILNAFTPDQLGALYYELTECASILSGHNINMNELSTALAYSTKVLDLIRQRNSNDSLYVYLEMNVYLDIAAAISKHTNFQDAFFYLQQCQKTFKDIKSYTKDNTQQLGKYLQTLAIFINRLKEEKNKLSLEFILDVSKLITNYKLIPDYQKLPQPMKEKFLELTTDIVSILLSKKEYATINEQFLPQLRDTNIHRFYKYADDVASIMKKNTYNHLKSFADSDKYKIIFNDKEMSVTIKLLSFPLKSKINIFQAKNGKQYKISENNKEKAILLTQFISKEDFQHLLNDIQNAEFMNAPSKPVFYEKEKTVNNTSKTQKSSSEVEVVAKHENAITNQTVDNNVKKNKVNGKEGKKEVKNINKETKNDSKVEPVTSALTLAQLGFKTEHKGEVYPLSASVLPDDTIYAIYDGESLDIAKQLDIKFKRILERRRIGGFSPTIKFVGSGKSKKEEDKSETKLDNAIQLKLAPKADQRLFSRVLEKATNAKGNTITLLIFDELEKNHQSQKKRLAKK